MTETLWELFMTSAINFRGSVWRCPFYKTSLTKVKSNQRMDNAYQVKKKKRSGWNLPNTTNKLQTNAFALHQWLAWSPGMTSLTSIINNMKTSSKNQNELQSRQKHLVCQVIFFAANKHAHGNKCIFPFPKAVEQKFTYRVSRFLWR